MDFLYEINEETQKVTITGVKDCPSNLIIPSAIIHTDNKEYIVDSVRFGKLLGGKSEDDGLICESISFSSTITSVAIVKNSTIKKIVLPNSLIEIGRWAFFGCERLEKVVFPDTLEIIDESAFCHCNKLKEVIIPDSVKKIGDHAFYNCVYLTNVKLSKKLTELGMGAFSGCSSLQKIVLPKSLQKIDYKVFKNCAMLSDVQLQENQSITPATFVGCKSLKFISQDFVIEDGFLFNKDKTELYTWLGTQEQTLVDYVVPSSVKAIGYGFCEKGIRSIDLSLTKITEIHNDTFSECHDLEKVVLPDGIKRIGDRAFNECEKLESINFPNSIEELGIACFYNCSLKQIIIPTGLKEISQSSFKGCGNLSDIFIPKNITIIDSSAFAGCTNLMNFRVDLDNPNYCSQDGILYDKHMCSLICFPGGKKTVSIPESVKQIEDQAFYKCSNLTTITIPNTITSIGSWAFEGCTALTDITIPNSVKSIGNRAFYGCPSIKKVRISIGYKESIDKIFENSKNINIDYIQRSIPHYYTPRSGAYTHGSLGPCPYCGSNNVRTYCDGTAECESCGGEYTYWRL